MKLARFKSEGKDVAIMPNIIEVVQTVEDGTLVETPAQTILVDHDFEATCDIIDFAIDACNGDEWNVSPQ